MGSMQGEAAKREVNDCKKTDRCALTGSKRHGARGSTRTGREECTEQDDVVSASSMVTCAVRPRRRQMQWPSDHRGELLRVEEEGFRVSCFDLPLLWRNECSTDCRDANTRTCSGCPAVMDKDILGCDDKDTLNSETRVTTVIWRRENGLEKKM